MLGTYELRALGDLSSGAFDEINAAQVVVSVAMASFCRHAPNHGKSVAIRPFSDETLLRPGETSRKRAATLCHLGRHNFDPAALKVVPEWPLVYWWDDEFLEAYIVTPKLAESSPGRFGANTGNNARFTRFAWEPPHLSLVRVRAALPLDATARIHGQWAPYVLGGKGRVWQEPLLNVIAWQNAALELKTSIEHNYGTSAIAWKLANADHYFQPGDCFHSTRKRV